MNDNLKLLKNTKIQYCPDINSHNKTFAPFIIFIKRVLRKLLKFIGASLVEDINKYHALLVSEIEALHSEIDNLNLKCKELHGSLKLNAKMLDMLVIEGYKRNTGVLDGSENPPKPLASSVARQNELIAYADWAHQMCINPVVMHRKNWEWVYIVQALFERGMLKSGKKGLGFAVGSEPLPALFAKYDVKVTATDLNKENAQAAGWIAGNLHAANISALERPAICDNETFYNNVSFMPLDMNNIPDTINGFDFCWSSCAFEHLGGVRQGREFILNTLKVLNPGGVSVHTTEFNLSTEGDADTPFGIIFGKTFFESLRDEIIAMGHHFVPLDYRLGNHPDEEYVYRMEGPSLHFKILLNGYISTSIGIIIIKNAKT